jgi:molybdenum cofactor cytidylyltransferase
MTQPGRIIPVILAAGSSERLGFPKPLAMFANKTALSIAVENCSSLGRPIVVLGCDAAKVRSAVPHAARIVVNKRWRKGQLSSLLCALDCISLSSGVLIYPVDLPLLRKNTIRRLVRAFRTRKPSEEIVMPRHNRTYGHPILISPTLRGELAKAKSAREVVYRLPERIRIVEVNTSAIYEDFQTPESYRRCVRRFKTMS